MASSEDWRSPDKRRIVIKQLEEAIRHCPGSSLINQNPADVEKTIFEKSKSEEDYTHKIRSIILMLAKHKVSHSQPPAHIPMAASHNPTFTMGPGAPMAGSMPGMNPTGTGMMNRPGLPQQQPQYYQPSPVQHAQPPQYTVSMQQPRSMVMNPRPMMSHNPGVVMPQQAYQPHNSQTMTAYGMQPPQMEYAGGMPPGYGRGIVGQPGGMAMQRPQMRTHMVGVGVAGRVPMVGRGMVLPPAGVQQPGGMVGAGGGGGGMMAPHPHMGAYGGYPEGLNNVQPVTAVQNPAYPMPGGGTRPPSVPPYSGMQGAVRTTGVPSPYSAIPASPSPAPVVSSAAAPPPDPTSSQPSSSSAPPTAAGNPPTPHPPSQQSAPSPAPPTPILGPISPATSLGSPAAQPIMAPEENEAYLRLLQDLQKHIPLLSRMLSRLGKHSSEDNKRNDQYVKLRSLFTLLQDHSKRVPLTTLQKCAQLLEKISDQDRNKNRDLDGPPTPVSQTAASVVDAPVPPFKPPPEPSKSPSLMSFKMIPSPPPTCSNLLETIRAKPLPAERLPPAKRLCNREEQPSLSPSLLRELSHLEQFVVHRLPPKDKFDKAVVLECALAGDGLPQVPTIIVRIPPTYPLTSPECDLTHYQDSTPFLQEVGRLLAERLARSSTNYTLSSLLSGWETSVLRAVASELSSQEE